MLIRYESVGPTPLWFDENFERETERKKYKHRKRDRKTKVKRQKDSRREVK